MVLACFCCCHGLRSGAYAAMVHPLTLHVLLFQEPAGEHEVWIAQCLEYDITAQGDTIRAAQKDFERTVLGEIVLALEGGRPPLSGIAPAPSRYQTLWECAHQLTGSMLVTPAPDLSPMITRTPDLVPRAEAEFRVAG
jgi:hypothetical protein